MSRILIVEDEKNISKLIEDTLHLGAYETEVSFDGEDALNKINNNYYDLILMDIMLPKMDGFEVLESITKKVPIIFLSAKNDVPTIVRGLKTGIDYMTKPFEPLELLARVELRISKKSEIMHYKNIMIDNKTREVTNDKKVVSLSPKEYELLCYFINNIDTVIERNELLNNIWGFDAEIETRTLDFHISELRKKLNLKEDLITVNRVGYRLRGK